MVTLGNTATIEHDLVGDPKSGPRHAKKAQRPTWWPGERHRLAIIAGAIFVLGFVVRSVGLSRAFELWVDEMRYAELGRSVSFGQLPNLSDGPFFLHPPGFFLLEGATIRVLGLTGDSMSLVYQLRWLNALVGAVGIVLIFLIVRTVGTQAMAGVAAVIMMFEPFVLRNNSHVMLETLGVTATLGGLLIVLRELRRNRPRLGRLAAGGIALGYGVLTKDVFIVASALPVLAAVWWRRTLNRREASTVVVAVMVPYTAYLLVLLLHGAVDDWAQAKWSGVLRMIGINQDTGFNAEGAPSLLGRLITQVSQFGTSYVLLAACPVAGWVHLRR
jgi:4-amino-4-deoxy-L-arabinose transferase-like glycosyltransferase